MKNYYSIGELAGYQNISKQTLIFYDKIGLFRPAYVDPSNGYRYYSPKQIDFLDTILIMKKIGFSLEEIREHMKNYNLENSTTLLRGQMEVLDEQIRELQMIRSRLLQRCNMMDEARKYHKNPIVREEVKEQYILCHPVAEPYSLSEVSIATKQCFAQAERGGIAHLFSDRSDQSAAAYSARKIYGDDMGLFTSRKGCGRGEHKKAPGRRVYQYLSLWKL